MSEQQPPEQPSAMRAGTMRRLNVLVAIVIALVVSWVLAPNAISSMLLFLGILVVLVVVHEFAHFATAKLFGIKVLEFGVGFPPRAAGRRWGETEYTLNWLPLGGFVRLLGEEDPDDPRSLASAARWKRFIVLISGSITNLLLPILLFATAFTIPHEESIGRAVVETVVVGAPAEAAGFQYERIS